MISVRRHNGRSGFRVETSEGTIDARFVVSATGAFQKPVIPPLVPADSALHQIHSSSYHRPQQLPDGAVLVVGAGSSGVQIADELRESGRTVYLAVGPHDRPPRNYRGRDFCWWLGVLGKWDMAVPPAGAEHVTIAVSGAHGGHTVDFRSLAADGITLLGRAEAVVDGVMTFADDLRANIEAGDANYLSMLDEADAHIARNGLDLPEEPQARVIGPDPACVTTPVRSLDLAAHSVTSIVWATGFAYDYDWLQVAALDELGRPRHQRGVSSEPGVYFLGLPCCRDADRASSGVSGTTPSISPIRSPSSAVTSPTKRPLSPHAEPRHLTAERIPSMSAAPSRGVTHTRIRPFNTRDTYPEQNLDNDLCQAVVAGGVVYLRGQIGQDLDTRESIGIGDVEHRPTRPWPTSRCCSTSRGVRCATSSRSPCISPTSGFVRPCTA